MIDSNVAVLVEAMGMQDALNGVSVHTGWQALCEEISWFKTSPWQRVYRERYEDGWHKGKQTKR